MGSFWPKYIIFELKEYKGVIFCDTEEWCKISRKTDLRFRKWKAESGKFSPEHSKVSKLGFWWELFIQNRKCMSLKFIEELCVMKMKSDANLERNQLVVSKLTRGIWRILTRALESLKYLHFNGHLLTKAYNVRAKKVQRSYVW